MYCIPVWGDSIKSETDELIKLQNKTLRILFQCHRSDDAWRYTNHKVLKLKQLYKHETAKLCYKHITGQLPETFAMENMPKEGNETDGLRTYNLRHLHLNKYKLSSNMTDFTTSTANVWNNLPNNLRDIPYNPNICENTYSNFKFTCKQHYISEQ